MFTFLPAHECAVLCEGDINAAKERLAWEVTALIHGKDEADRALAGAKAAFGGQGDLSLIPSKSFPASRFEAGIVLADLFAEAGLCASKSEARRLIQQGGAFVAGADGVLAAARDPLRPVVLAEFTDGTLLLRDGKKMGKTEKGAIFLDAAITPPYDFFQYWRNTQDADVRRFLLMFTFLPAHECAVLCEGDINAAKERLAWEVTALIHGKDEADRALSGAKAAFGGQGDLSLIPSKSFPASRFEAGIVLADLFAEAGLCASKSEARRLIQQGGAFVSGADGVLSAARDPLRPVVLADFTDGSLLLRAGKKRYARVMAE
jgi:tyrosyl-tRNA synthetase